jgi:hypothetical protein
MFCMSVALLDMAASAPRSRPSGATGRAATGVRRQVNRWLGRLADIGVQLAVRLRDRAAHRRAQEGAADTPPPADTHTPGTAGLQRVDLALARDLVARALRWSGALCTRLAAEAQAAKAARTSANRWREPAERLNDWDEGGDDRDWVDGTLRRLRKRPPVAAAAPDPCIDGLATGAVVEQICIDLGIVAVLFRSAELGRQIGEIAGEAHALLGGAAAPWTAPPIPPAEHAAAIAQQARWEAIGRQILAAVGAPVGAHVALPVPDTG